MTNLPFRLIAATAATATTLVLFNSVVSIAEPQRSVLIAKLQRSQTSPPAPVTLAVVANHVPSTAR